MSGPLLFILGLWVGACGGFIVATRVVKSHVQKPREFHPATKEAIAKVFCRRRD